jgi:hypothetical protein
VSATLGLVSGEDGGGWEDEHEAEGGGEFERGVGGGAAGGAGALDGGEADAGFTGEALVAPAFTESGAGEEVGPVPKVCGALGFRTGTH